jgi:hypothetical protein
VCVKERKYAQQKVFHIYSSNSLVELRRLTSKIEWMVQLSMWMKAALVPPLDDKHPALLPQGPQIPPVHVRHHADRIFLLIPDSQVLLSVL